MNVIKNALKKPCNRTLLVALDLTAAFNTVDYNLLLRDILEAPITNATKRWVAATNECH